MSLAALFQLFGFASFIAGIYLVGGLAPALLCAGSILFVAGGLATARRR